MVFLPSLDCVLECSRMPDEIRRVLELVTVQQNKKFFGSGDGEFTGTVSNSGFEIVPKLAYRNSFAPVIRGWIKTDGETSKIVIKMKMHSFTTAFCTIWFGSLFFFLVLSVFVAFADGILSALPMIAQLAGMGGLGLLMVRFGFQRPAKKSLERLKELLGGKEI